VCSGHVLLLGPGDRWGEAGLNLVIYASRPVGKRSRNLPPIPCPKYLAKMSVRNVVNHPKGEASQAALSSHFVTGTAVISWRDQPDDPS